MTGNKPDERLRTPMQWRRGQGGGFTRGKPWESLQADSLTTNVEAQDADPNSLLNLYRRLIHLRAANVALGSGELIPLVAGSDAVAAYLRRSADHVVLVIANLGTVPLSGVTLESHEHVLREARYEANGLLGGLPAAPLQVRSDERIQGYVPLGLLKPMETYIFELSRSAAR
jgi:glycosidase